MAVFGRTPLAKAVSGFAGDFNQELLDEMSLLYAPQQQQIRALADKTREDQNYQSSREQALAGLIADDRGMDRAGSTALARMISPQQMQEIGPVGPMGPPPPADMPPTPVPYREGGPLPLPQFLSAEGREARQDMFGPLGFIGDIPQNIPGALSTAGNWLADLVPSGEDLSNLGSNIMGTFDQPFYADPAGMTMPVSRKSDVARMVSDEGTQILFSQYPGWDTTGKILGVAAHLRDAYEAEGDTGIDRVSGEVMNFLRESEADTRVRTALTDLVTDITDEAKRGITGVVDRMPGDEPRTSTAAPGPVRAISDDGAPAVTADVIAARDTTVAASDTETINALRETGEAQPPVDGRTWLDWLSAVDSGKKDIYNVFKGAEPSFRLMNPRAEGIYDDWERQLRHQYNIEMLNPGSSWGTDRPTSQDAEGAAVVNKDYREYLKAAFDPNNRTAHLWGRDDWQVNMSALYNREVAPGGRKIDQLEQGAGEGEQAITAEALKNISFDSLARDPNIVKEWIIAKSMKGANPIVARYGPDAVSREVDKWVMDNTVIPDIGPVTAEYPSQLEASGKAAKVLFEEWAKRDFKWFGSKGYGGQ